MNSLIYLVHYPTLKLCERNQLLGEWVDLHQFYKFFYSGLLCHRLTLTEDDRFANFLCKNLGEGFLMLEHLLEDSEIKDIARMYKLSAVEENGLCIFRYRQGISDFSERVVREARGLVVDVNTKKVVGYPFDKFFDYVPGTTIAFSNDTRVLVEKIDGSMISMFYHEDEWKFATMSRFVNEDHKFFNLLNELIKQIDFEKVDHHNTYMLELVDQGSPIVINYQENALFHIGTRNNLTKIELPLSDIGLPFPRIFDTLRNESKCLDIANTLTVDPVTGGEGFILVDDCFNRYKIKGRKYLEAHSTITMTSAGSMERDHLVNLLDIMLYKDIELRLKYFPKDQKPVDALNRSIQLAWINWSNMRDYYIPEQVRCKKKSNRKFMSRLNAKKRSMYDTILESI
eukprot:TRINITY_DN4985_c0_g1_i1.p1 TRINITY_DN4985_c0_g1~~TRINITY_DN4985_c0_g1_i1.p1  ORF type:complete len:451 (-),score=74.14 TRINITY_DN4985_c0_g1_i1:1082-2278(-)